MGVKVAHHDEHVGIVLVELVVEEHRQLGHHHFLLVRVTGHVHVEYVESSSVPVQRHPHDVVRGPVIETSIQPLPDDQCQTWLSSLSSFGEPLDEAVVWNMPRTAGRVASRLLKSHEVEVGGVEYVGNDLPLLPGQGSRVVWISSDDGIHIESRNIPRHFPCCRS